ncbi:hypothetical protein HanRHA438_Chr09g0401351 [Helianthus annuus]|nr:hypothetical protein HanIR_Chr09g0420321 [Helianthus annuus]KAJ0888375.1 hypothetical protein HanRHA438_Chr09g0401351 [Helianthus annuus]
MHLQDSETPYSSITHNSKPTSTTPTKTPSFPFISTTSKNPAFSIEPGNLISLNSSSVKLNPTMVDRLTNQ